MTSNEFLQSLKSSAADSSVQDTIKLFQRPPGRRPAESLLKLAKWYSGLDESNKALLREALAFATETAVFGVLCILDGARAVEASTEKGDFEVYYVRDNEKQLLNHPSEPLHESFRKFMDYL